MTFDWKQLVGMFGPVVLASVPHGERLAPLVPTILHGITEAEQMKGATGAEKKAHVLSIVGDAVTSINQAKGRPVLDPDRLNAVAGIGIDTVIGAINVVRDAHNQPGILLPPNTSAESLGVHAGGGD